MIIGFLLVIIPAVNGQNKKYNFDYDIPSPGIRGLDLIPLWTRMGDQNGESGAVEAAIISPNGKYIASGSKYDNQVILWNVIDGTVKWQKGVDLEVEGISFSPDSKYFASGGEDARGRVFETETGNLHKTLQQNLPIDAVAWSNNGDYIVAGEEWDGDDQGYVWIWDSETYELIGKINHGGTVNSIYFTEDDGWMVTGGDNGKAKLWNTGDFKLIKTFGDHNKSIKSVRFSPDERTLATAGSEGDVKLWKVADTKLIKTLRHDALMEAVEFSPDGRYLLTGGIPQEIRIYRMADFFLDIPQRTMNASSYYGLVKVIPTGPVEYLHFHSNGLLATAHEDGLVRTWLLISDPTINDREHLKLKVRQKEKLNKLKNQ